MIIQLSYIFNNIHFFAIFQFEDSGNQYSNKKHSELNITNVIGCEQHVKLFTYKIK